MPVRIVIGADAPLAGWVVLRLNACPCCVGRAQLQIELARLIRERRPLGVLLQLADASHLPAVRRTLGERPLSDYVAP